MYSSDLRKFNVTRLPRKIPRGYHMAVCIQIYVEALCFDHVVTTYRWRNCHVETTCYC